jgi:hypothetical protein
MLARNLVIACGTVAAQSANVSRALQCFGSLCPIGVLDSSEKHVIGLLHGPAQPQGHLLLGGAASICSSTSLQASTPAGTAPVYVTQQVAMKQRHSWAQQCRQMSTTQPGAATQTSPSQGKCWHCQQPVGRGSYICEHCNKLQPVDPTLTHFEVLGM